MAPRAVLQYPHQLLKQKSKPIERFDEELASLFADLTDTMRAHPGCVGLAAVQIGVLKRALVVDVSGSPRAGENRGLLCLVNPEILEASRWKISREGCLSFPRLVADVKRARRLLLRAYSPEGKKMEWASVDFEAVALQHEIDHLDGILFLDRIRSAADLHERRSAPLQYPLHPDKIKKQADPPDIPLRRG